MSDSSGMTVRAHGALGIPSNYYSTLDTILGLIEITASFDFQSRTLVLILYMGTCGYTNSRSWAEIVGDVRLTTHDLLLTKLPIESLGVT